jgi:hypothetical protein
MKVPDRVSVEDPPTARKSTVIRSLGDVRRMLFTEVGKLRIETALFGETFNRDCL